MRPSLLRALIGTALAAQRSNRASASAWPGLERGGGVRFDRFPAGVAATQRAQVSLESSKRFHARNRMGTLRFVAPSASACALGFCHMTWWALLTARKVAHDKFTAALTVNREVSRSLGRNTTVGHVGRNMPRGE